MSTLQPILTGLVGSILAAVGCYFIVYVIAPIVSKKMATPFDAYAMLFIFCLLVTGAQTSLSMIYLRYVLIGYYSLTALLLIIPFLLINLLLGVRRVKRLWIS